MNVAVPPIGATCFFRALNQPVLMPLRSVSSAAAARPKRTGAVISADWHSPV
jgi:hypothetical protein